MLIYIITLLGMFIREVAMSDSSWTICSSESDLFNESLVHKMYISLKNLNSVINCSPSCCSKGHWLRTRFSIPMHYFPIVFLCKHMLEWCVWPLHSCLLQRLTHECTFLRRCEFKEFKLLHRTLLINVSSKTVDQSEDPEGGASFVSFCLQ